MKHPVAYYLTIPYLDKGRDPSTGLDCWGLVRWWYAQELDIALPEHGSLTSIGTDLAALQDAIRVQLHNWQPVTQPQWGDLLLVRLLGRPIHVGICLGDADGEPRFLHAREGVGVAVSRMEDPRWKDRIEACYRHRGAP